MCKETVAGNIEDQKTSYALHDGLRSGTVIESGTSSRFCRHGHLVTALVSRPWSRVSE